MITLKWYRIIGIIYLIIFIFALVSFINMSKVTLLNKFYTGEPGYDGFDYRPWSTLIGEIIFNYSSQLLNIIFSLVITISYLFVPERKLNKWTTRSVLMIMISWAVVLLTIVLILALGAFLKEGALTILVLGFRGYVLLSALSAIFMIMGLMKKANL